MTICFIVAKLAETKPFIEQYGVAEQKEFFAPLPFVVYSAKHNDDTVHVVLNGRQNESDLVGCEAAAITTLAVIEKLHPDLIINSGTCGAFEKNGACIGDVYIGNGAMFHDRRVPGDDAWFTQSLGNYPVYEGSESLARALGFKTGKVTTGSSLDMQPCDLEIIEQNGGELKDMEGAAIAFVCSLTKTPVMFVKSVTDLCDNTADTLETFMKNLSKASAALSEANIRILDHILRSRTL